MSFTEFTANYKLCDISEFLGNLVFHHRRAQLSPTSLQGLSRLVSPPIQELQKPRLPRRAQICPGEKPQQRRGAPQAPGGGKSLDFTTAEEEGNCEQVVVNCLKETHENIQQSSE